MDIGITYARKGKASRRRDIAGKENQVIKNTAKNSDGKVGICPAITADETDKSIPTTNDDIVIPKDVARLDVLGVLPRLLIDRSTRSNILWATNSYIGYGSAYRPDKPMEVAQITGENAGIIQNRAAKSKEQQTLRERQYAEVLTPLWFCNKMINYFEEHVLGSPTVFNVNGVPTGKAVLPMLKQCGVESWKEYVSHTCLEITCGEAPFLVSRYDITSGKKIEIRYRIGLLDRKLRVVNENAACEEEWLEWTFRAFKTTYGYELQGDSLLVARINLLATFEEYLKARWGREPTSQEYAKVVQIITWNIWQMDGLTERVPYFGEENGRFRLMHGKRVVPETQPRCRIYNWQDDKEEFFNEP